MHVLRIGIVSAVLIGILGVAPLAFADNDNNKNKSRERDDDRKSWISNVMSLGTTTAASLSEQIKTLQKTIADLTAQRKALRNDDSSSTSTKATRDALKVQIKDTKEDLRDTKKELRFLRSLSRGMSGDDVRDLQELLAADPTILSSAFVTGYFGPMTEEALRKFQRKHGIEALGIFGPKTQAKLLALFVGRALPANIIARLGLETSTTTPGSGIVTICHIPSGNTSNKQTLVIAVAALGAHLAHGDTVGVCPGSGTPPTDTVKPIISGISVFGVSSSTASISWTTNEAATGKIYYGTTTPVNFTSALTMSNAATTTGHSFNVTGLTASTTYYFAVESKDVANNTSTSSTHSFLTQ